MNSKEEKFLIDITKPKRDFDSHLSQPDNERIIFSGGFGTGKTYFLNQYFQDNEKYEVIHLYPVNYSIASNEDIMELIKYDIGFELLKKGLDFKKVSFDQLFTVQFFIQNEFNNIFHTILKNVAKAGKSVLPIGEALMDLKKEFDELAKKYNEFHQKHSSDQEKELIQYLKKFTGDKGSMYEENSITILIRELIGQLKSDKETVLIIDDLDRIDPEHIFRLLNVFSAHFDVNHSGNKFGFDKIILVCDVENIRNIFHAKYGMKVDFSGYIDKFYSKEIFKFDNVRMVADSILQLMASIEMDPQHSNILKLSDLNNRLTNEIHYILQGMIHSNAINLRSLIKLYKTQFSVKLYEIAYGGKRKYSNELPIILIFNFLKFVMGNDIALSIALQKCSQLTQFDYHDRYDELNKDKLGNLLLILDINQHLLNPSHEVKTFDLENNLKITYQLQRDNSSRSIWGHVHDVNLPGRVRYFELLEKTYHQMIALNMLK